VLFNQIGDDLFVCFVSIDGGGLVVLHEATVTGDVGAEYYGEFAVKASRVHADTSLLRRFGKIQDDRAASTESRVRPEPLNETTFC